MPSPDRPHPTDGRIGFKPRRAPSPSRRIILRVDIPPGDVVPLTGAVRDLHASYPGEFAIDVHTPSMDLWMFNPGLTPLQPGDPGVEVVNVEFDLHPGYLRSPLHLQQVFVEELNRKLGVRAHSMDLRGAIHLSQSELRRPHPLVPLCGLDLPYWLVAAGGKGDHRIKWWSAERYQQVVDHFRGRIVFVQIGAAGDHHPPLHGALDLRGRTSVRELIHWVHHAQGVLCGITFPMHLAAAVPRPCAGSRPCVVIAGGREPLNWFAYPGHQILCNVGQLPCSDWGCWKSRTEPVGDGTEWDLPHRLCTHRVGPLARCMDMIRADDVIDRIEGYLAGGAARCLTPPEADAARTLPVADLRTTQASRSTQTTPTPGSTIGLDSPPHRLCLVSVCDAGMQAVGQATIPRLQAYAERWGFNLRLINENIAPGRNPTWAKIPAVLRELESGRFDHVVWLDADVAIMNPAIDLRRLLPAAPDMVFSTDGNGLCAGIFAARTCPWSIDFLRAVWGAGTLGHDPDGFGALIRQDPKLGDRWEQNTIKHLLAYFPGNAAHVGYVAPTVLNSNWVSYRRGHFLLHLGVMTHAERVAMLQGIDSEDPALDSARAHWTDTEWAELRLGHIAAMNAHRAGYRLRFPGGRKVTSL